MEDLEERIRSLEEELERQGAASKELIGIIIFLLHKLEHSLKLDLRVWDRMKYAHTPYDILDLLYHLDEHGEPAPDNFDKPNPDHYGNW